MTSTALTTALIVGGGVGGMTAALRLTAIGVRVVLIDMDTAWRAYGAGITLTGLSLRALDRIGVLPEIRSKGFVGSGIRVFNVAGELQMAAPKPPTPTPIQSSGGILRSVLHEILARRVREQGIEVRLGTRVEQLQQDPSGVQVKLSDGSVARYDLVVAADGINSQLRGMIFPQAPRPQFTGQGCWRIVAPRPPEVDCTEFYYGGAVKIGLVPISATQMYLFLLEHVPDNPRFEASASIEHLRALMLPFAGHVTAVREYLSANSQINYRPLEWVLAPTPWYVGRVLLIGDAAHSTTPHMASGAGLAVEDSLVLAEELSRNELPAALQAFAARRIERARMVVLRSVQVGEIEMSGENVREASHIIQETMLQLQAEY